MPRYRRHKPFNPTVRLKHATEQAHQLRKTMSKNTSIGELAESLILQAILGGDVQAAAIATRTKLHRENMRLKQRIALSKLRTEQLRHQTLELTLGASQQPQLSAAQLCDQIRAIYGLNPAPQKLLTSSETPKQES